MFLEFKLSILPSLMAGSYVLKLIFYNEEFYAIKTALNRNSKSRKNNSQDVYIRDGNKSFN